MTTKKSLEAVLTEHGIDIVPDFTAKKQRNGSQWLFCHETEIGGKSLKFAYFGDYKKDFTGEWHGSDSELTAEEEKIFKKFVKEDSKARTEMEMTMWEETKLEVHRFLKEQCTSRGEPNEYFKRKKIDKLFGTLLHINSHGSHVAIIPMRDIDGVTWSYQRIYPEKLSHGDKFMLENGRIKETFFLLGELNEATEKVYICEGFATAASVFMAFNESATVVAAFNAQNLGPVSQVIRTKYPNLKIVLCADNDQFTLVKGEPYNTGLIKARAAAADCQGEVVWPRFEDADMEFKPTDFNDLHCLKSLTSVHDQILHPDDYKALGEIVPIVCKGKPSEDSIASLLVKEFKGKIIREDKDLFIYGGTHWELCETKALTGIRNMIRATAPGKLTSRDVNSAFATFIDRIEHVPYGVSMFTPNPSIANFKNGTLHLTRHSDGSYGAELRPHQREDFLTSCLPFDYLPESDERNAEFEAMLDRIWQGDGDLEAKKNLYAENLGSMFCGIFPGITIYTGKPGTGKSTLLLIASKLIHEKNLCMVDPTAFEGFNMESMPGKLVNIVTDLNTHKPISDELVKMICDRVKFRVRRKGLKDVYAYIPAVHLWACNSLPKSFEGASGAMGRRITIVETNKFQPVGFYNKEYHTWVWEQCPQGIINFAVRGLLRLIHNKGHYTKPDSSVNQMTEWRLESDVVGSFVAEMREGLLSDHQSRLVVTQADAMMERKLVWEMFLKWHKEEKGKAPLIGKIKFFQQMSVKGFSVVQDDNGLRNFSGIGVKVATKAEF